MASLNAPKKANTQKLIAKKKSLATKSKQTSRACSNAECSPRTSTNGVRRSHLAQNNKSKSKHTKIVVKCNCGFPNSLYLRGEGVKGLSWEKGTLMKCTKADEWVWETDAVFNHGEIKVLINDKEYELGENHEVDCGASLSYAPRFINS